MANDIVVDVQQFIPGVLTDVNKGLIGLGDDTFQIGGRYEFSVRCYRGSLILDP
ncbi:MAG: hypothetical protein KME58_01655 [Candidatus Thiodiazotropha sp. (ex Lucina pensylvanica)]|nr:hypothetical protein [Candidatus Thiodiazotropha sp. (ex Lucina pensylvanica)]